MEDSASSANEFGRELHEHHLSGAKWGGGAAIDVLLRNHGGQLVATIAMNAGTLQHHPQHHRPSSACLYVHVLGRTAKCEPAVSRYKYVPPRTFSIIFSEYV